MIGESQGGSVIRFIAKIGILWSISANTTLAQSPKPEVAEGSRSAPVAIPTGRDFKHEYDCGFALADKRISSGRVHFSSPFHPGVLIFPLTRKGPNMDFYTLCDGQARYYQLDPSSKGYSKEGSVDCYRVQLECKSEKEKIFYCGGFSNSGSIKEGGPGMETYDGREDQALKSSKYSMLNENSKIAPTDHVAERLYLDRLKEMIESIPHNIKGLSEDAIKRSLNEIICGCRSLSKDEPEEIGRAIRMMRGNEAVKKYDQMFPCESEDPPST